MMILAGFVVMLINAGLSFPVFAYTPIGIWYESVDRFGRSHGWDDGLSLLFGAVLWQWVWIPLAIRALIKKRRTALVTLKPTDSFDV